MCCWLCTIVLHNTAQNSSDNLPSYPPDNHHGSDLVTEGRGRSPWHHKYNHWPVWCAIQKTTNREYISHIHRSHTTLPLVSHPIIHCYVPTILLLYHYHTKTGVIYFMGIGRLLMPLTFATEPTGGYTTKSVTQGQCDARPRVTFPAAECNRSVPNYTAW